MLKLVPSAETVAPSGKLLPDSWELAGEFFFVIGKRSCITRHPCSDQSRFTLPERPGSLTQIKPAGIGLARNSRRQNSQRSTYEFEFLKAALDMARSGTGRPQEDERETVEAVIWPPRDGG